MTRVVSEMLPQEPFIDVTDAEDALLDEEEQLVPIWLAVLVLVLLLAVMGVGGYIVRGMVAGTAPRTSEEMEIERWREEVRRDPQDVQALLSLGFAYQQDEKYDQALDAYGKALKLAPTEPAANYNRGVIYETLDLPDKAEEAFWDVLEVEADHTLAAKALGEHYLAKKQYRSLVKAVRPAVEAKPQMADLQYLMGAAYENLGEFEWAKARYELAVTYVPDMKEAREGLKRMEAETK